MRKLLLLSVLLLFSVSFVSAFSGAGAGTPSSPFVITTCSQLQEMKNALSASYVLGNNIDCSATSGWNGGLGWEPIGKDTGAVDWVFTGTPFTGNFNGNFYNITNLTYSRTSENNCGLFGGTRNAIISNVGLVDFSINGRTFYGTLIGWANNTTITSVFASGKNLTGGDWNIGGYMGGLVGALTGNSTLEKSYTTLNVIGGNGADGGLVAMMDGSTIRNCYSSGRIYIGRDIAGGIVGYMKDHASLVENCYSRGDIYAQYWGAGGIVVYIDGNSQLHTIKNSFSLGTLRDDGRNQGGIVANIASGTTLNASNDYYLYGSQSPWNSYGTLEAGGAAAFKNTFSHAVYTSWDKSIWKISPTVNGGFPYIVDYYFPFQLTSPSNGTVFQNANPASGTNVTLSFNVTGYGNLKYNNGITNVTYTAPVNLTMPSAGTYNFVLYANNSTATISRNLTFFVQDIAPTVEFVSNQSSYLLSKTQTFECNISDGYGVSNLTLMIWNSTGGISYSNTTNLTGRTNSTSWTHTFTTEDTYSWNCVGAENTSGLTSFAGTNRTIIIDTSDLNISWLNPLSSVTFWKDFLRNVTFNVTCLSGDEGCGDVSVGLYANTELPVASLTSGACGGYQWSSQVGWPYDAQCPADPTSILNDNDLGTMYGHSGAQGEMNLEFNYASSKLFSGVDLYWRPGGGGAAPGNYYISYWDGAEWVSPAELSSEGGTIKQEMDQWQTFNLSTPVETTKIKLTRTGTSYGQGIGLAEFQITAYGLVSNDSGDSTVYINGNNPEVTLNLATGESRNVTFPLISTFNGDANYSFFAKATRLRSARETVTNNLQHSLGVDSLPPVISNVIKSPDAHDDVDPGVTLEFNATVIDAGVGVDTVLFNYYNATDAALFGTNVMTRIVGTDIFTTSITTVDVEQLYDYEIVVNDSQNHEDSVTGQFESYWDCTWHVDPTSFGAKAGWDSTMSIGNLTIINTGDSQYKDDNCTLDFRIRPSLQRGRVLIDGGLPTSQNIFNKNAILAKTNRTFEVAVQFLDNLLEEFLTLTTEERNGISESASHTSTATIVSSAGGPYLFQTLETSSLTRSLTPTNISLDGYVSNLLGNDSEQNTAYNVTFNWSLPDSFLVQDGTTEVFFENISDNAERYNNINITFNSTNLKSMSAGTYTVHLYSQGYVNASDNESLIKDANNNTLQDDSMQITFLCYTPKDGICVKSCGTNDLDCTCADLGNCPASPRTSGGGGGGGGAAGSFEKSEAQFELLRGADQEFQLPIENKLDSPKRNITITVTGTNSEYVTIEPTVIDEILGKSSKNLTVKITAPSYFSQGKYLLKFNLEGTIDGAIEKKQFTETKFVTLYIVEVTRQTADGYLNNSERMIQEMNASGFYLNDVEKYYSLMQSSYKEVNFLAVEDNYKLLNAIYSAAYESKTLIDELYAGLDWAQKRGISTIETKKLLYVAETIYKRGDYLLALKNLKDAKLTYALEVKGEFNLFYEIQQNPKETAGIIVAVLLFSFGGTVATKLSVYKKKLKMLDEEEKLLLQLMKVVQAETFEKNKMSMEEYGEAMGQYERKLAGVINDRIMLQARIANLMKVSGKRKSLAQERERLIELMKQVQDSYMRKGEIETRVYENMFKIYNTRLAKVEEELLFIEAKSALKGRNVPKKQRIK